MFGFFELVSYSFFLSVALKSAAVLAAAWLSTRLLYRQSAAVRHLVWTTAFAALFALPFLSLSLPAVPVPWQHSLLRPSVKFQTNVSVPGRFSANRQRVESSFGSTQKSPVYKPGWATLLLLLWAAGTAVNMAQILISWSSIQRIRRAARPLRCGDFGSFVQRLGIARHPDLLEAKPGTMPMTFGFFRSAIFIPADAANWTEERRSVVLLHELAHVSRGDTASHLLARIALGVYWWNPLAWMGWREFIREREHAADDLVLSSGARAAEYATHLLEIARSMHSGPVVGWTAVAMARPRQLEERLKAILEDGLNRRRAGRRSAIATALLAIAIVAPLAALRAQDTATVALPTDLDSAVRAASAQKDPEMLNKAAEAAEALGKFDVAQNLLDTSLSIRGQLSGSQSSQYGVSLLKLGDLARERGKLDSAKTLYTNALLVLGDGPDAATALIHLGSVELANEEMDQATEDLTRAQSLNAAKAGEAALWMAIVEQRQKNFDKADALFQNALGGNDPSSAAAATTMEVYAEFLQQQGRMDQAKSMQDQASAIRKDLGAQVISETVSSNSYRIGGGVSAPKLVSKLEPIYSFEARTAKYSGTVTLRVEIGPDGAAHNVKVIRGLGLGLNERAIAAISQWKFNPGTKDGEPVTVMANVEVNFRLF